MDEVARCGRQAGRGADFQDTSLPDVGNEVGAREARGAASHGCFAGHERELKRPVSVAVGGGAAGAGEAGWADETGGVETPR